MLHHKQSIINNENSSKNSYARPVRSLINAIYLAAKTKRKTKHPSLSMTMTVVGVALDTALDALEMILRGSEYETSGIEGGFEKNEITDWVAANWPCSNQSFVVRMRLRLYYVYHSTALYSQNRPVASHSKSYFSVRLRATRGGEKGIRRVE